MKIKWLLIELLGMGPDASDSSKSDNVRSQRGARDSTRINHKNSRSRLENAELFH